MRRLVNQIWKLLPMRENDEDWQKQLDSVLIEIRGLGKMFGDELNYLIISSSLEGLTENTDFIVFRSEIFSIISMMTELMNIIHARE
jgi:hypothetical protein